MTTAADTTTEPDQNTDHDHPRDPAREHPQGPRLVPAALLAAAGDAPQWQDRALCAQTDPEAFFAQLSRHRAARHVGSDPTPPTADPVANSAWRTAVSLNRWKNLVRAA